MKQPPPIPLSAGHGGRSLRRADCCLIRLERLAPNALTPARGDVDGEPECVRQRYHVLDANSVWDGTAVIALKWFAYLSRRGGRDVRIGAPTFGGSCGRMCNEARSAGAQPAAH